MVVRNMKSKELYEIVEVKFNIKPDAIMVMDAYKKIKDANIQRYYILSTVHCDEENYKKKYEEWENDKYRNLSNFPLNKKIK